MKSATQVQSELPRESVDKRFETWIGKMKLVDVVNMKYPFEEKIQSPEKWARFKTMFSMVREVLGERNRRSAFRTHYYDETLYIVSDTIAAMMFVEEEIGDAKKGAKI